MDVGRQGLARSAQLGRECFVEFCPTRCPLPAHARPLARAAPLDQVRASLMKIGRPTSTTMTANIEEWASQRRH